MWWAKEKWFFKCQKRREASKQATNCMSWYEKEKTFSEFMEIAIVHMFRQIKFRSMMQFGIFSDFFICV